MSDIKPEAVDYWMQREATGDLSYGEQEMLKDLRSQKLIPESSVDNTRGADAWPRAKAAFASTKQGEQSAYQQSYPQAKFTRNPAGDLLMQPQSGGQYIPVNKPGLDLGDVAGIAGSIPEIAGSLYFGGLGAAAGATAGGVGGAAGGVGTAGPAGAIPGAGGGVITGGIIGAALGSGLGAGVGEGVKKIIGRNLLGIQEKDDESSDRADVARVAAMNTLLPMGLSIAGRLGGKALRAIPNSVASKVTDEGRRALDFIKSVPQKFGMPDQGELLQPAVVTESRIADVLHNVARGSITGQRMVQFEKNTDKQLNAIIDAIQGPVKLNPDEVGDMLAKSIQDRRTQAGQLADTLYEQIRAQADPAYSTAKNYLQNDARVLTKAGATFNVQPIVDLANAVAQKGDAIGGVQSERMGFGLADKLSAISHNPTFSDLQSLRSALKSYVREMDMQDKKSPGIGLAKQAIQTVDGVMRDGLQRFDPKLLKNLDAVDAYYADTSEKLYNKLTQRIIQRADVASQPEQIFGMLFKPGAVNPAKEAMDLADKPTKEALERLAVQTIIKRSTVDNQVVGSNLDNVMFGKTGLGDQTLNAWIRPEVKDNLKELANVIKLHQDKQGGGIGSMWVQMLQARGLSAILGSIATASAFGGTAGAGTAALSIGAPAVLSRMLTNPKTIKLFIEGSQLPQYEFAKSAAATRLIAAAIDSAHDLKDEIEDMNGTKKQGPLIPSSNQRKASGRIPVPMIQLPVSK